MSHLTDMDLCRARIDEIDRALLKLLADRQAVVEQVKVIKAREGLSAAQPARAAAVIENARMGAARVGLNPDLAETLWRAMVAHFIAEEEKVLGTGGREI